MRLIEKMNKIVKDNERTSIYCECVIKSHKSMMVRINKLKEIMTELSQTRKTSQSKERFELSKRFLLVLQFTEAQYENYWLEMSDLLDLIQYNTNLNLTKR